MKNTFLKKEKYLLLIIILVYFFIILRYISFVPFYDAWEYTSVWIYNALNKPFNPLNFDSTQTGRPSWVYFLLLGLPQYFDLGNQYLLHLVNIILFTISIYSFQKISEIVISEKHHKFERYFSTTLYAFFPIFLGNSIHISPDFGMFVFYVIFFKFVLYEQYLFSIISALGLIFSKDPGILLYSLTIIIHFGYTLWANNNIKDGIFKANKKRIFLFIPIFIFLVYLFIKIIILKLPVFWQATETTLHSKQFTSWNLWFINKIPYSYFLAIFIINFNWILSIFILSGLINYYIQITKKSKSDMEKTLFYKTGFLYALFIAITILLTFFKTFTNLRYFLPIYFLMIVLFVQSTLSLIKNDIIRRLFLTVILIIFIITNFRTFDPLSKRIYGTFKFGSHEMLKMTSITGECCGYGRDQLVYNLEFAQIHFLLNKIFEDLRPTKDTAIVYHYTQGPYILARINNNTYNRSLKKHNSFEPNNLTWTFDFLPQKPETLYFLVFPNADSQDSLSYFLKFYKVQQIKSYENNGYSMEVYKLVLNK